MDAPSASRPAAEPRRWPLFTLGVLLALAGPALYAAQVGLKNLSTPWYAPILGSIGVALMGASVWRRPGVGRMLGLAAFVLLCGLQWFFVIVSKTPEYTGPARPGSKLSDFRAQLASGQPFTDESLEAGPPSVLVFFRGRW